VDHDRAPAPVIDDDLEMVMPETGVMSVRRDLSAEYSMSAAVGDPSELLVILVDEAARMTDLITAYRQSCRSIDIGQARQTSSAQYGSDGRGRMAEVWTEPIRTPAQLVPSGDDPLDLDRRRDPR
jgi:hypothetical protein